MIPSGRTRVFALIGHPIAHSPSPALHNAWFRALDIDAVYVALPAPRALDNLGRTLLDLGLAGVNLTLPHKVAAAPHLDALDPSAEACGAVNTVVVREGRTLGFNTDVPGLQCALAEAPWSLQGHTCAVLGAGGAARAAAIALHRAGVASIDLYNRSQSRARRVIDELKLPGEACPLDPVGFAQRAATYRLVINALPGAARSRVSSLPAESLHPSCGWVDLNYWDDAPPHLDVLRAAGHPTQRGTPMLLHQAALAFEHFTGLAPDLDLGRRTLARNLPTSPPSWHGGPQG
ncbi:MAG: shikimate dehydrogenase [Deltaproteobacteria bacterium]|nr:MAG: shikimate dehydrogenase [Deltaproteobacteria bacterium]